MSLSSGSSVSATDLLSNFVSANGDPHGATIMGIRLQWWALFEDSSGSTGVDHNLWIGIIKGDYEASADVPFPIIGGDVQHRDWMYLEQVKPAASLVSGTSSFNSNVLSTGYGSPVPYRDIKARRRLDELGETCWLVAQRETADTGMSINFEYHTSTMLLLP